MHQVAWLNSPEWMAELGKYGQAEISATNITLPTGFNRVLLSKWEQHFVELLSIRQRWWGSSSPLSVCVCVSSIYSERRTTVASFFSRAAKKEGKCCPRFCLRLVPLVPSLLAVGPTRWTTAFGHWHAMGIFCLGKLRDKSVRFLSLCHGKHVRVPYIYRERWKRRWILDELHSLNLTNEEFWVILFCLSSLSCTQRCVKHIHFLNCLDRIRDFFPPLLWKSLRAGKVIPLAARLGILGKNLT